MRDQTDIAPLGRILYFLPGEDTPPDAVTAMTDLVDNLNKLVGPYHDAFSVTGKLKKLEEMRLLIQAMDDAFPPDILANSDYPKFRERLLTDIQTQESQLGKTPVYSADPTLSDIIHNMSPEKANKLLVTLNGRYNPEQLRGALLALYSKDDMSQEAQIFRTFMQNHTIRQTANSTHNMNFVVSSIANPNQQEMLKIEDTLGTSKRVENHVRAQVPQIGAPVTAQQLAFSRSPENPELFTGKRIKVTPFYQEGSLASPGWRQSKSETVGPLFEQMANTLFNTQEAGCLFVDGKNENWLVDDDGGVVIDDFKSFVFLDKNGNFSSKPPITPGNEYNHKAFQTPGYTIPESTRSSTINADAAHAFLLGKNLYYFATSDTGIKEGPITEDDLQQSFFDTHPQGQQYRLLILQLTHPNPKSRLSLEEGLQSLFSINNPEAYDLLERLKDMKFGKNDTLMDQYIREQRDLIIRTIDPRAKNTLVENLAKTVQALESDQATQHVRETAQQFKDKSGKFTVGMNDKANRIESAMRDVPILERAHLATSPHLNGVEIALASRRYASGKTTMKNGEIDEKKAAKTFHAFKGKLEGFKANATQVADNQNQRDPEPEQPAKGP